MATYGHQGGGWMNDDQRDSVKPRSEHLAKPLASEQRDLAIHEIIKVAAELCREPGEHPELPNWLEAALNAGNCRKARRLKLAVDMLRKAEKQ